MIIQSAGETLDLTIKFKELDVRLSMDISNDDAGGKSSSTETLNSGIKPKRLSVSCTLAQADADELTSLIKMAESVTSAGARTVFTVSHKMADAADIREVIFHDRLDVRQREGLNAWQISFTLREYNSVPEVKEQRKAAAIKPVQDSAAGETVASNNAGEQDAGAEHGTLYNLLKKLDDYLAPDQA